MLLEELRPCQKFSIPQPLNLRAACRPNLRAFRLLTRSVFRAPRPEPSASPPAYGPSQIGPEPLPAPARAHTAQCPAATDGENAALQWLRGYSSPGPRYSR